MVLAAGVSPQQIRVLGRWSSDVYEIYCRLSLQSALTVGVQLSSAEVDPVDAAFHEEHSKLQPVEVERFKREMHGGVEKTRCDRAKVRWAGYDEPLTRAGALGV